MRRVIVESPWAGRGRHWWQRRWDAWMNRLYAKDCCTDSIFRDEAPFAGHLFYTLFLDDGHTGERNRGLRAGKEWLGQAELVAVYVDRGVSPGMRRGIEWAKEAGVPWEYRSLNR